MREDGHLVEVGVEAHVERREHRLEHGGVSAVVREDGDAKGLVAKLRMDEECAQREGETEPHDGDEAEEGRHLLEDLEDHVHERA